MTQLPTNVVDLARFRKEREQARLPLFEGPAPAMSCYLSGNDRESVSQAFQPEGRFSAANS